MDWRIGTIGFSYADWRDVFFAAGTSPSDYLSSYSTAFDSVELDTTFHAIPTPDRVKKWVDAVGDGFTFAVKTPKHITHDAPIAFGLPPMKEFLRALRPMQHTNKLGPILLQFSPALTITEFPNIELFLKDLPTDFRYALEFRHPSWEIQRTFDLLKHHRCCWVTGDYGTDPFPIHATTDFLFLRLMGIREQFPKFDHERLDMSDRLQWWTEQLLAAANQTVRTVYAFCADDYAGHAPATANRLRRLVGLPVHVPADAQQQHSLF